MVEGDRGRSRVWVETGSRTPRFVLFSDLNWSRRSPKLISVRVETCRERPLWVTPSRRRPLRNPFDRPPWVPPDGRKTEEGVPVIRQNVGDVEREGKEPVSSSRPPGP